MRLPQVSSESEKKNGNVRDLINTSVITFNDCKVAHSIQCDKHNNPLFYHATLMAGKGTVAHYWRSYSVLKTASHATDRYYF